jgi:hypothetical protein
MERYKDLEKRLQDILENLDSQIAVLNNQNDIGFHKSLINIMSVYPESKEIIQFVVDINDRLETKNEIFKDLVYDSIRNIVYVKQQIVIELIKELKIIEAAKVSRTTAFFHYLRDTITPKVIIVSLAIILIMGGVLIAPNEVMEISKRIFTRGVK